MLRWRCDGCGTRHWWFQRSCFECQRRIGLVLFAQMMRRFAVAMQERSVPAQVPEPRTWPKGEAN